MSNQTEIIGIIGHGNPITEAARMAIKEQGVIIVDNFTQSIPFVSRPNLMEVRVLYNRPISNRADRRREAARNKKKK